MSDDVPDKCDYNDCPKTPRRRVTFRDPTETLYYCIPHTADVTSATSSEYSVSKL